jgi:hypothetical protein
MAVRCFTRRAATNLREKRAVDEDKRMAEQIESPELLTNREVEFLRANIGRLFQQIADPGFCKGCGEEIFWLLHRNGKKVPYTRDALNHFADCREAQRFKSQTKRG